MRRLLLAAVTGLCAVGSLQAQEGFAPTVPVVPPPVVQDGKLMNPSGGRGSWGVSSGPRLFAPTRWLSNRGSTSTMVGEPVALPPGYAPPAAPLPPLPPGVGGLDSQCSPSASCRGRDGLSLDRLKAWLCYAPSKSDLPKCQPTPYIGPLQGMFGCTSGCAGCATGHCGAHGAYPAGHPQPLPGPNVQPMPQPSSGAGPVLMPSRGTQGAAVMPTWKGKVAPAPARTGLAGYRFATVESKATTAPSVSPAALVNTTAKVPPK